MGKFTWSLMALPDLLEARNHGHVPNGLNILVKVIYFVGLLSLDQGKSEIDRSGVVVVSENLPVAG